MNTKTCKLLKNSLYISIKYFKKIEFCIFINYKTMELNKFNVEVEADMEETKVYYTIICSITRANLSLSLTFSDSIIHSLKSWENLLDSIQNNKVYNVSGGGNSSSSINFENGILTLDADVSGNGGDTTFVIELNTEDATQLVTEIIAKCESAVII